MESSASSFDLSAFEYCERMKLNAMHLPCGKREECTGCARAPKGVRPSKREWTFVFPSQVMKKEPIYQPKPQRKEDFKAMLLEEKATLLEKKECSCCGKTFLGGPRKKYCSLNCNKRASYLRSTGRQPGVENETCPICGKVFRKRIKTQKFCSSTCTNRAKNRRRRAKEQQARQTAEGKIRDFMIQEIPGRGNFSGGANVESARPKE